MYKIIINKYLDALHDHVYYVNDIFTATALSVSVQNTHFVTILKLQNVIQLKTVVCNIKCDKATKTLAGKNTQELYSNLV